MDRSEHFGEDAEIDYGEGEDHVVDALAVLVLFALLTIYSLLPEGPS